ncbi:MAG: hypothetical protein ACRD7E_21050, partial [Bryobacteraceae bacterium]
MRIFPAAVFFAAGLFAQSIDVPLTVEETAGVARKAESITFGVPLPRGALREVSQLRLYDPEGNVVPAAFRVANRWWDEAQTQVAPIQWIHGDFFADVPAGGRVVYRLRNSGVPAVPPPARLRVQTEEDSIKVDTGPLQFTVHRKGPFLDAPGLGSTDFRLRSAERIYKAGNQEDSRLEVEEENPLRIVLKRTGSHTWVDKKDRALDYVLRIIAYAGQPHIRLVYSFINRQGRTMADFVRLDGLWLEARLIRMCRRRAWSNSRRSRGVPAGLKRGKSVSVCDGSGSCTRRHSRFVPITRCAWRY